MAKDKLDIHIIGIDVTSDESCKYGVQVAEGMNGGPIEVLVNNAGIGITSPVEVQDMDATRLIFETNVFGAHRMARAVLPGMRKKGASQIIQISSQLDRVIVPFLGHYSATKFALEAMSEQLAYELVPHNIDVTVIEPGGYPTKVWVNRNAYSQELKDRAEAIHTDGYPLQVAQMGKEDGSGRRNDPMDVARGHVGADRPASRHPTAAPAGQRRDDPTDPDQSGDGEGADRMARQFALSPAGEGRARVVRL